jgi:arylsulfatase A-like enzyme
MKHKNALTPNIDKLVGRSTAFTSHFTGIVPCGPARTTMLTGLYPFIHRSVTNGAPLDKRFTNIAKEVKKLGYVPDLYGYTDTSWDPRYLDPQDEKNFTYESPMDGFNSKCLLPGGNPEAWAEHLNNNGYKINHASELYESRKPKKGQAFIHEPYYIPTEYSDTAFLADKAIEDLKSHTDSFFMHISFLKPHPPMYVSEPWHSLINPNDIDLPIMNKTYEEMMKDHPFLKEIICRYTLEKNFTEIRFSELTDQDIKNIIAVYLGMCAEVDFNVGKIINALEESGKADNTMIIFTSDHGEMLGEQRLWGKLGWWDSSYRIPLIVHVPEQSAKIITEMTESVDLSPTILDWLDAEIPTNWNGRSLLPTVENTDKKLEPRDFVVFEFDFRENHYSSFVENKQLAPEECSLAVIRTQEWKYVHFPSLPCMLFDLKNDPHELVNLANQNQYMNVQHDLLSKLLSHRMRHSERQLSNIKLSSKGVLTETGPADRKISSK